ncbi:HD domain-containing protein [Gracilinema caldarium]|uniref:HD domain-containing protein n=1 Tax=Gracilinema caldarium TaxID=215591 RepID=UPI0026F28F9F|nr:HD domain-containing protein [Gracilinema caldarium]
MKSPFRELLEAGWTAELIGFSALDRYFNIPPGPVTFVKTTADLPELSRLFENLRFPGAIIADAAADLGEHRYYFYCAENHNSPVFEHSLLNVAFDQGRQVFIDNAGLYPVLKEMAKAFFNPEQRTVNNIPWLDINANSPKQRDIGPYLVLETAVMLSRYSALESPYYFHDPVTDLLKKVVLQAEPQKLPAEMERTYLELLLTSNRPDLGFSLLMGTGLMALLWPELAMMDRTDHSKEFHPEGNVWRHTLETFRHRKKADLLLSLGLLLHDSGKSLAESSGGRRFDRHAELGADLAKKFLERLGYSESTIGKVQYLVRNHMMPAALPRLPLQRTQETLESPLFPTLLELYRCDEASSFKGLDNYYESAAAYQNYLRNVKNPYRRADGKKL